MANTFWEKDFLIMCSYMSQSADCFMHSGFLLHIISNYALQILCGEPHKICDDDGIANGKPLNRLLTDEDGNPYDVLKGTFFICGLGEEDFDSISDELAEKYDERFRWPEMFTRTMDGHVIWIRLEPGATPKILC